MSSKRAPRMKKCTICKEEKTVYFFNKKKDSKDGKQPHCRECNKARSKAYYRRFRAAHKTIVRERNKRVIVEHRVKYIEYLLEHPCEICGESYIRVLEADHIRGKKFTEVSKMIMSGYSWARIELELSKCRILCSNCHAKHTHAQNNSYRHKWVCS